MNFTNSKGLLRRLSLRLRLTKKTDYGYTTISNNSKFIEPIDKLGQLEDIEEELGIDLITLINVMRNGVYVINVDNEIIFEEPVISINQEEKTDLYVLDSVYEIPPRELCESCNYYLKDYGKTWALTKEELENEK